MKTLILTSMLTAVSLMAAQSSATPGTAAPKTPDQSTSTDSKKPVKRHHKNNATPKSGSTATTTDKSAPGAAKGSAPANSAPVNK